MGQNTDEMMPRRRVVITSAAGRREVSDPIRASEPDGQIEDRHIDLLKHEIRRTRADMSVTIDAIQDKLSPDRIKKQVRATVRGATVGKAEEMFENTSHTARSAGSSMIDRIRENPVPAAMVAIGLGWLLTKRNDTNDYRRGVDDYYDHYYDSGTARTERVNGSVSHDDATDESGRVADRVSGVAGRAKGRLDEATSQVQDRAANLRDGMDAQRIELSYRARSQAHRARSGLDQLLTENPLAVGAVAVAAGAIVGLAAPVSDKENQVLGQARDRLVDQAEASAQEAVQKAQRVAQRTAGAAQGAVEEEIRGES